MRDHGLFRVDIESDWLWLNYLESFPEGTNPMFRKRSEHDCSCCRGFVKTAGKLVSIWDVQDKLTDPAYKAVALALATEVKSKSIQNVFLYTERKIGQQETLEIPSTIWNHFCIEFPKRNRGREYIVSKKNIGERLGERQADYGVMHRSLSELSLESVDTVLEMVGDGSLYRGEENKFVLDEFRKLKAEFDKIKPNDVVQRSLFAWKTIDDPEIARSIVRIRNTSIGTLLIDLSEDMNLEDAVKKYERVVAPTNYKRPTALVTKRMVEDARKAVADLGLTEALERRFAKLSDISVNDILFVNNETRRAMSRDAFDLVETTGRSMSGRDLSKIQEVSISEFIETILSKVSSVEVMLENRYASNLVSLVAPQRNTSNSLFKWSNDFSWAYSGDVADSIKERVKKAGGNVTGDLCCRLSWFNYDDLDFHMVEPGRNEISFANKGPSISGGRLDVDMNAGGPRSREAVENIFYTTRSKMREGAYHLFVRQYSRRETDNVGFEVEIDYLGDIKRFSYPRAVAGDVTVAKFNYTHAKGVIFGDTLPSTAATKTIWGLRTNEYHRVNILMKSPNHWNDAGGVGNQHYFFMIDGCVNDTPVRPFFNEFLKPELNKHRKVLEMLGGKLKTAPASEQLSGIGFSTTQRDEVLVRVSGKFNRMLKLKV